MSKTTNLDIQQEVYDRLKENFDTSTFIQKAYDNMKHEYTGTIDELRHQFKLGLSKWINEL